VVRSTAPVSGQSSANIRGSGRCCIQRIPSESDNPIRGQLSQCTTAAVQPELHPHASDCRTKHWCLTAEVENAAVKGKSPGSQERCSVCSAVHSSCCSSPQPLHKLSVGLIRGKSGLLPCVFRLLIELRLVGNDATDAVKAL